MNRFWCAMRTLHVCIIRLMKPTCDCRIIFQGSPCFILGQTPTAAGKGVAFVFQKYSTHGQPVSCRGDPRGRPANHQSKILHGTFTDNYRPFSVARGRPANHQSKILHGTFTDNYRPFSGVRPDAPTGLLTKTNKGGTVFTLRTFFSAPCAPYMFV